MLRKYILIIIVLLSCISAVAATPLANFSALPTSGGFPFQTQFLDLSTDLTPTSYQTTWIEITATAPFVGREGQAQVVLQDGSIVMMGGFDGVGFYNDVWRSTDEGVNWVQQTAAAGWAARSLLVGYALPDGSIVITAGVDGGVSYNDVWRSTDQGANWVQQTAAAGWNQRSYTCGDVSPNGTLFIMGGNDVVFGLSNDVWSSNDQGATWNLINPTAGWSARNGQMCRFTPNGNLFVAGGFDGGLPQDVWMSNDNGTSWVQRTAAAAWTGRYAGSLVDLADNSLVFGSGLDGAVYYDDVWRSTDTGASWTLQTDPSGWSGRVGSMVAMPSDNLVVVSGAFDQSVWRAEPIRGVLPPGATFYWTFGDGGTSTLQNPLHIYTYSGSFTPSLTTTSGGVPNTNTKVNYITVISSISNATPLDIQGKPNLVLLQVKTIMGKPITDATVSIQGISTTTGTFDWIYTMLGIPLDEAPIQNTLLSGTTDSLGETEFMMVPTTKYNVSVTAPGYTFPNLYIYPHDLQYTIIANPLGGDGIYIPPAVITAGTVNVTVNTIKTTPSYQGINITYVDSSSTTTGGFVNLTQDNATVLLSFPIVASSFTINQDVTVPVGGTNILVSVNALVGGTTVKKSYTVWFRGAPVSTGGFDPQLVMWGCMFLLIMTGMIAGATTSPQVSVLVCVEAWIFLTLGWLNPLVDQIGNDRLVGLFMLATIITIIWNIREAKRKETGR